MLKQLSNAGLSSDMAYGAAFASILASIVIWVLRRGTDDAHAERFGIFVGLWAPTFMIIGRSLEENERTLKISLDA